ncbi:flagellar FliL protein [Modicisalibacter ilicicola DSM 19980]|uniref:Flagellar protein FliL n=1 Tax=Modicisalibacter ilicicola DSM 19980 TaxID=1121942 RepID=A0A1M4YZ15_9GAMM|nr:flagellar basal body-associated protein FliL [Halomonas ilicicola]SHF11054.1 flagellar FliL protein [Halomonas ilicicola DSM 19980]
MANNQNTDDKSRKPWWLFGILIIAISMASSAAVYYLLAPNTSAHADESQQEAPEPEPIVAPTPIFVSITPFTVNVQSDYYEQRLLYIGLSLKVGDEETAALIEENMPQVRSRLLMLLSAQYAEELTRPEGKEALANKILALFDEPFGDPQPPLAIDDVLYTDFIVQ